MLLIFNKVFNRYIASNIKALANKIKILPVFTQSCWVDISQGMSKFFHKVRNSSNLLFVHVVAAVSSEVWNLFTLF